MTAYTTRRSTIDPRPSFPLQILATRYTPNGPVNNDSGYTLIFLHATGMHKETWEVTIGRLFDMSRCGRSLQIRDIFSIESPNHGESAILNDIAIQEHFGDNWPTREYARAAHIFLTAGPLAGAEVDFSCRKLVGIGHSIGAAALFLMRDLSPRINFHSIIALEAGISVKDFSETLVSSSQLTAWTWLRQDVWPNRKIAKDQLASSPVFKTWDPRVLDLYIRYGLRQHPAAKYAPPFTFNGVTTSLSKVQEAASYRSEQLVVDAMEAYSTLSREIPVHLVWGKVHDVGTPGLQKLLVDRSAGREPASVSYVDNAGHLVVQQKPESVAEVLYSLLSNPKASL